MSNNNEKKIAHSGIIQRLWDNLKTILAGYYTKKEVDSKITTIDNKNSTQDTNISNLSTDITNLKTNVSNLSKNINTYKGGELKDTDNTTKEFFHFIGSSSIVIYNSVMTKLTTKLTDNPQVGDIFYLTNSVTVSGYPITLNVGYYEITKVSMASDNSGCIEVSGGGTKYATYLGNTLVVEDMPVFDGYAVNSVEADVAKQLKSGTVGTEYRPVYFKDGIPKICGVSDSTSASKLSGFSYLVTERDVYYGLPKINNSKNYDSDTNIYAPTSGGTKGQILASDGNTKEPVWSDDINIEGSLTTSKDTSLTDGIVKTIPPTGSNNYVFTVNNGTSNVIDVGRGVAGPKGIFVRDNLYVEEGKTISFGGSVGDKVENPCNLRLCGSENILNDLTVNGDVSLANGLLQLISNPLGGSNIIGIFKDGTGKFISMARGVGGPRAVFIHTGIYVDEATFARFGFSSKACKFDIYGNLTVSGTITGSGNDYAEWFEKEDINELEIGTVISAREDGTYGISKKEKDPLVVGVISDTYGNIVGYGSLNDPETMKKQFHPIGLSGRTKVRVIGKVYMGDLLVTSDHEGVARRFDPEKDELKLGIVFGKSLQTNTSEEIKTINMLIMMV